jgi:hypothetical protein
VEAYIPRAAQPKLPEEASFGSKPYTESTVSLIVAGRSPGGQRTSLPMKPMLLIGESGHKIDARSGASLY